MVFCLGDDMSLRDLKAIPARTRKINHLLIAVFAINFNVKELHSSR